MIGGNITATLQMKTVTKNSFGEKVSNWNDVKTVKGYLDYTGGDGSYNNTYKGELVQTTHIFMCDYFKINLSPAMCRFIIDEKVYDILMFDDVMELHKHLEIYLKYNEAVTNG